MPLSEFTRRLVEKKLEWFCREKIPEIHRSKVQLGFTVEDDIVTLFEERAMVCDPLSQIKSDVAQFRYDEQVHTWTLYYMDRNARWDEYYLKPKADFEILLREVDEDPLRVFWE